MNIVETGTVRFKDFAIDGGSTLYIADWIKSSGQPHTFVSMESHNPHIETARGILKEKGLESYCQWFHGEACLGLHHFGKPLDLCYLDAGPSAVANLEEFRWAQVWMRSPSLILIDDSYLLMDASYDYKGMLTIGVAAVEGFPVGIVADRLACIGFGEGIKALMEKIPEFRWPRPGFNEIGWEAQRGWK
jgi:predicted O-methyltransferase YrrM